MMLGVDVGGTNTDAVLLTPRHELVAKAKVATSADVSSGIAEAMEQVVQLAAVDRRDIRYAMLGTTHCINALLEQQGLERVAVVRIGAPASEAIPPLFDWPIGLRDAVLHSVHAVGGANEFDGRPMMALDEAALRRVGEELRGEVGAVVITSVFSPVSRQHELAAREILSDTMGGSPFVSLSHEIGTIGLLERENATVLNGALHRVARAAIAAFRNAARQVGTDARLFLGQNDGTLMNEAAALRYPILTVASGPTNSIRGAAFLAGVQDAIVVDVGGTSTDLGVLKNGFPLESAQPVEIAGVRTNFRMPDTVSLALGGGSRVRPLNGAGVSVGPDSVGYRVTSEAVIFGGSALTVTDVAVGVGRCQIGDGTRLQRFSADVLLQADEAVQLVIENAVERVRIAPQPLPVVVVGGGAVLVSDHLDGAAEVVRPGHYDVANAIGVAIADVGADVDTIIAFGESSRKASLERARRQAVEKAVAAGAKRATVRIATQEEIPLTYLPGNAVRVRVKACGPLDATEG